MRRSCRNEAGGLWISFTHVSMRFLAKCYALEHLNAVYSPDAKLPTPHKETLALMTFGHSMI